ncbi:uncharacterized protein [Eurosta solidaginis]|uniref:uncharacterized protein isoform X1 n=1 Tax=Eurosta solidaginis TaxID=178769 RepID=UPI003530975C
MIVWRTIKHDSVVAANFSDGDLTAVSVEVLRRSFKLASFYLAHDHQGSLPPDNLKDFVRAANPRNDFILLGGDANAHHAQWGSSDTNDRAFYNIKN